MAQPSLSLTLSLDISLPHTHNKNIAETRAGDSLRDEQLQHLNRAVLLSVVDFDDVDFLQGRPSPARLG
ncbi:MAG: hypothetical protein Q8L62_07020 [Candidatus Nitrotoga sp.]|nr:hypothetical protein [Candidatus Nitrotoga sp.]